MSVEVKLKRETDQKYRPFCRKFATVFLLAESRKHEQVLKCFDNVCMVLHKFFKFGLKRIFKYKFLVNKALNGKSVLNFFTRNPPMPSCTIRTDILYIYLMQFIIANL